MSQEQQATTKMLKVTEVAAMTGLPKSTIYLALYGGSLTHVRFGRSLRTPESAGRD